MYSQEVTRWSYEDITDFDIFGCRLTSACSACNILSTVSTLSNSCELIQFHCILSPTKLYTMRKKKEEKLEWFREKQPQDEQRVVKWDYGSLTIPS